MGHLPDPYLCLKDHCYRWDSSEHLNQWYLSGSRELKTCSEHKVEYIILKMAVCFYFIALYTILLNWKENNIFFFLAIITEQSKTWHYTDK